MFTALSGCKGRVHEAGREELWRDKGGIAAEGMGVGLIKTHYIIQGIIKPEMQNGSDFQGKENLHPQGDCPSL